MKNLRVKRPKSKNTNNYSEIREMFLKSLSTPYFTLESVKSWFMNYRLLYHAESKGGDLDIGNIHRMVIRELEKQGRILKVNRNLWQVVFDNRIIDTQKDIYDKCKKKIKEKDKDEFDLFLERKLKKGE